MEITHTIGRRKTAVARVYVQPGNGTDQYDVAVNVFGGGYNGQAEAIRMAVARALCKINAEHRPVLKSNGLLTRDPRMVERKKFGQRKARRRFQFSKR